MCTLSPVKYLFCLVGGNVIYILRTEKYLSHWLMRQDSKRASADGKVTSLLANVPVATDVECWSAMRKMLTAREMPSLWQTPQENSTKLNEHFPRTFSPQNHAHIHISAFINGDAFRGKPSDHHSGITQ